MIIVRLLTIIKGNLFFLYEYQSNQEFTDQIKSQCLFIKDTLTGAKQMKSAIIMINDSELDSETLSKIGADFFYCLFDRESLYSTDNDSHFFVKYSFSLFMKDTEEKGIKKIIIYGSKVLTKKIQDAYSGTDVIISSLDIIK